MVSKLFKSDRLIDQKQLVLATLVASLCLHFITLAASQFDWFTSKSPLIEEWSIETDLVSDLDVGSVDKTVIPDAKESDKALVPSNLLPQITKKFAIEQPKQIEEGSCEGPALRDEKSGRDQEKNENLVATEPNENVKILKKNEALKRLVMDKLRREQKEKSRELTAQKNDALAALKEAAKKGAASDKGVGGLLSSAASRNYQSYLTKAIRRNYSLPKNYKFSDAKSMVLLAIRLDARGNLLGVEIKESSGDSILDNYCIEAVRRSTPFEKPPQELMGSIIQINFKP